MPCARFAVYFAHVSLLWDAEEGQEGRGNALTFVEGEYCISSEPGL